MKSGVERETVHLDIHHLADIAPSQHGGEALRNTYLPIYLSRTYTQNHVCMDRWMMDGWLVGWLDGWMDGWMEAQPLSFAQRLQRRVVLFPDRQHHIQVQ